MEVKNCEIKKLKKYEKDENYDYYKITSKTYLNLESVYYEILIFGNPLCYEYEFVITYNDNTTKTFKNCKNKQGIIIMLSEMIKLFCTPEKGLSNKYISIEIKKLENCYMILKTPYVVKNPINLNISDSIVYENLNYLKLDQNTTEYKIKKDNKNFKYFNILYLLDKYINISYEKTDGKIIYEYDSIWNFTKKLDDDIEYIILNFDNGNFKLFNTFIFFYEETIDIKGQYLNVITENLLQYYEMNFPFTITQLTSYNIVIKTPGSNYGNIFFSSTLELREYYNNYNMYYEYSYIGEGTTILEFKNQSYICNTPFYLYTSRPP